LPSPAADSSYLLNFDGPTVTCSDAPVSILEDFRGPNGCNGSKAGEACLSTFWYLAWTPAYDAIVPFANNTIYDGILPVNEDATSQNYSYLGSFENGPASIFISVNSSVMGYPRWRVLNCSLWDSTYTVQFDPSGGSQVVDVVKTRDNRPVGITRYTLSEDNNPNINYKALMDCFGRLLVGSLENPGWTIGVVYSGNVM
jgi:hypothetical protein